jgi:hypothetical protein
VISEKPVPTPAIIVMTFDRFGSGIFASQCGHFARAAGTSPEHFGQSLSWAMAFPRSGRRLQITTVIRGGQRRWAVALGDSAIIRYLPESENNSGWARDAWQNS